MDLLDIDMSNLTRAKRSQFGLFGPAYALLAYTLPEKGTQEEGSLRIQASGGYLGGKSRTPISIVTDRPNAPHRAVKDEDLYGTTGETCASNCMGNQSESCIDTR